MAENLETIPFRWYRGENESSPEPSLGTPWTTQVVRKIRVLKRANSMTAALEDDYNRIHEMHKDDLVW